MEAYDKSEIRTESLFTDGEGLFYRITWLHFTELITYKFGEPLQLNEVHADVYKEDKEGVLQKVDTVSFLHIKALKPVSIKEKYLRLIGFTDEEHEGRKVLKLKNAYFDNLNEKMGVHLLQSIKNDAVYPVTSMHEVQLAVSML